MDKNFEVVLGDITTFEVDAIVNAANRFLAGGSGVDGAIHRAAGPELLAECRQIGGCPTGEARITKAYKLPCKHVIHAIGPRVTGYEPTEEDRELLRSAYHNSLVLANQHKCATVAFASISTGHFAFDPAIAAPIAVNEILSFLDSPQNQNIQKVIMVCFTDHIKGYFEKALQDYLYPITNISAESGVENDTGVTMKKEDVLKQYWKSKKCLLIHSVIDIIFWCLALMALYIWTISVPSAMEPIEWVGLWVLALILAYVFGIVFSLNPLIKARRTIQKIKAEEYQIYEDTVVDKYIEKGPFLDKLYFVKFANYEPEGRQGPHKNSILVDKKGYKKAQIGDVRHYLVLNDNKGRLTCIVHPELVEKGK